MNELDREVLSWDLKNLTPEQHKHLHEMRNIAMVRSGWLQLQRMRSDAIAQKQREAA